MNNIERNTQSTAASAASAAQNSAATARAAQSAATGAWAGAGFQAVTAFQSARAARAAEEQREMQRVRNEQAEVHEFSMWVQTAHGAAFVAWREGAVRLAQFLRDRDAEWLSVWARVIGRAQAETPEDEKQRVLRHPARLKQTGLKIAVILSFVIASLYGVGLMGQVLATNISQPVQASSGYSYEKCLEDLNDPDNFLLNEADCEAIRPQTSELATQFPLILFLGLGVTFVVVRRTRQRAAKTDLTVAREAQSRIERWGFDPLAVRPGYAAFPWYRSQNADGYSDQLMDIALHGHIRRPSPSQLITLVVPDSRLPDKNHPVEVNRVLEKFQYKQSPHA